MVCTAGLVKLCGDRDAEVFVCAFLWGQAGAIFPLACIAILPLFPSHLCSCAQAYYWSKLGPIDSVTAWPRARQTEKAQATKKEKRQIEGDTRGDKEMKKKSELEKGEKKDWDNTRASKEGEEE